MESAFVIILPFVLILARVSAFVAAMPLLSSKLVPAQAKITIIMALAFFLAVLLPQPQIAGQVTWLRAGLFIIFEILPGLALALAANFIYLSVQQGARIASRQMGFEMASVLDPTSGEQYMPVALVIEMTFAIFFLVSGGHRLLLRVIVGSYSFFPSTQAPNLQSLAGGVLQASSAMLLFAMHLAAPLLAAFLILAVVLAILARVLPEMNILMASFPMRVGLGLLVAAALMPSLDAIAAELADWMGRNLTV